MNKRVIIQRVLGWLIMLNIFPVLFIIIPLHDAPFGVHPYVFGLMIDAAVAVFVGVLFLAAFLISAD